MKEIQELLHLITVKSHFSASVGKWNPRPGLHIGTKDALFSPRGAALVGRVVLDRIQLLCPTASAVAGDGVGGAAIALATATTAQLSGKNLVPMYVRQQPKTHGTHTLIEGETNTPKLASIVVVDDTIDTGRSISRVIEMLTEYGYAARSVIVLVTRSPEAIENLHQRGIAAEALFCESDIVDGINRYTTSGGTSHG